MVMTVVVYGTAAVLVVASAVVAIVNGARAIAHAIEEGAELL